MTTPPKSPFLLCILDGVGVRAETAGNAVASANAPILHALLNNPNRAELMTHGAFVGLPDGQMGNSEVGHMTIGSGRIILQSLDKIRIDFETGAFESAARWQQTLPTLQESRAIHVLGMISDGGVHSHADHAVALCTALNKLGRPVFVHVIADGRDTPPKDAHNQLSKFAKRIAPLHNVAMVDICGRFYTMDRDNRWDRVEAGYNLLTNRTAARHAADVLSAITQAHEANEADEFIQPTTLDVPATFAFPHESPAVTENDALVCFNFRADRMRQIVRAFIETDAEFTGTFTRPVRPHLKTLVTMTEYDATFGDRVTVLYPAELPANTLGEVAAQAGMTQLRIAESEKYAHVTFFLNGGREEPFAGEDRIVIPSPKVTTYDQQPEMSLPAVTDKLVKAITSGKYDFIVLNIANGDQVGHAGSYEAAVQAVENIDAALARILPALKEVNGQAVIIADHGNCEEMTFPDGSPNPSHSLNPVPVIYVGSKEIKLKNGGLADVAPTVLTLMNLPIPAEMTGTSLII